MSEMLRKMRKINHSARKSLHLQIGYNLNFATTAKALYIGQRIRSQKSVTGIDGRKDEVKLASMPTTWIVQVKNDCGAVGLKDIL